MAADAPLRRMIVGLLIFLTIGLAWSIWRGDRPATTVAYVLAGAVGGGFVIACYWGARRRR